ncbi:MAG: hypothetical protein VX011_05725, partial [Candidatus Thermoplasmatota archaeon]|nr:hypothetical protein [Candidatus Thermoplasmatota archaeon]
TRGHLEVADTIFTHVCDGEQYAAVEGEHVISDIRGRPRINPAALIQNDEEREQMYRHVEACVRRAIDLDRRLTQFADHLTATEVEHCRFRIRQLTGLDDVASKLSSEHA